jgi:hypothetical protein
MDIEQILFIAIAIALSVFSMYKKSKKQKQSPYENETSNHDFSHNEEPYEIPEPVVIFKQYNAPDLLQNSNISTKKNKKSHHTQNKETSNLQRENSKNISQNTDLEKEISLLEDFDGTEIQKAFLYSEIFKNTKS